LMSPFLLPRIEDQSSRLDHSPRSVAEPAGLPQFTISNTNTMGWFFKYMVLYSAYYPLAGANSNPVPATGSVTTGGRHAGIA
jgi:hypothetical protein